MFVSVGSASNDASGAAAVAARLLGGLWDREQDRADVLAFDPEGGRKRIFAAGLRNCTPRTLLQSNRRCLVAAGLPRRSQVDQIVCAATKYLTRK
jgi:hypothetical protein